LREGDTFILWNPDIMQNMKGSDNGLRRMIVVILLGKTAVSANTFTFLNHSTKSARSPMSCSKPPLTDQSPDKSLMVYELGPITIYNEAPPPKACL
jgi:hypothetical protein